MAVQLPPALVELPNGEWGEEQGGFCARKTGSRWDVVVRSSKRLFKYVSVQEVFKSLKSFRSFLFLRNLFARGITSPSDEAMILLVTPTASGLPSRLPSDELCESLLRQASI